VPEQQATRDEYWSLLQRLAKNRNVFVKLSEVALARSEQKAPVTASFNHDRLEELWNIFGEDHVLYASDWPNSDHHATYEETFSIVRNYVAAKGPVAEEKFFWKNSVTAYRWHRRAPDQPVAD
jgi:L-fuconolactonase